MEVKEREASISAFLSDVIIERKHIDGNEKKIVNVNPFQMILSNSSQESLPSSTNYKLRPSYQSSVNKSVNISIKSRHKANYYPKKGHDEEDSDSKCC